MFAVFFDPVDAVGAEGAGEADDVEQVPAGAALGPLPSVGVVEVAEKEVADELVVEGNIIVAKGDGVFGEDFAGEDLGELSFADAGFEGGLGGEAGGEDGEGAGEDLG